MPAVYNVPSEQDIIEMLNITKLWFFIFKSLQ